MDVRIHLCRRTCSALHSSTDRDALLQLHGADDGCILPARVDDRHRFAAPHALEVVPDVGHFLHIEAPEAIAERIAAWAE
ncbi:alpha/beta fold hydrolase [Streptomyces canus]|uniref:alpha/beta fold hydrolase n=1 Tax=Streptomyces canus TaxID=58343 RepID=UPI0027D81302|nr:alpha/beta hydrolase [Streptomyces canus]